MNTDLALVLGLLLMLLALPVAISAFSSARPMRLAAALLVLGGASFTYAMTQSPTGYGPADIPQAVLRVIAEIVR
jgi:nitrate/nitrite transporter NarK